MLEENEIQQDEGAPESMDTDADLISKGDDEPVVSGDEQPDAAGDEEEPDAAGDDEVDDEEADMTEDVEGDTEKDEEVEMTDDKEVDASKDEEAAAPVEEEIVKPKHPYESELQNFKPNSWQCEKLDAQKCGTLEEGKFTYVDTEELLGEMMATLKEAKEIAIDVEHHSYRSYKGIVCLVQVSTRSEDFLIDSLKLKEHMNVLNEVCTNKDILKVLHGSDRDITWLQRDFGVYIVNMFDTQLAAKLLKEEVLNLARLLNKYCDVTVNKKYQMADWRTRPLPEDMVTYARQDTHYLLYLYDTYRNLLLERGDATFNLLNDLYTQSANVCLQVYVFQPDTYMRAYRKCKGQLNKRQLECFRLLHEWRNRIASEKDESTGYTLPNKMMFSIAKFLPRDEKAMTECCNTVPELVQEHMENVIKLVEEAFANITVAPEKNVEKGGKDIKKGVKKLTKQERIQAIKTSKLKRRISKRQWCLECGVRGHWATDCPAKRNRGGVGPPFLMKVGPNGNPPGTSARGAAKKMRGRGLKTGPYPAPRNPHPYANPSRHLFTSPMSHGVVDYRLGPRPFGGEMSPYGAAYNAPPQFNAPRGMNPFNAGPRGFSPRGGPKGGPRGGPHRGGPHRGGPGRGGPRGVPPRGVPRMPPPHYAPYYQW